MTRSCTFCSIAKFVAWAGCSCAVHAQPLFIYPNFGYDVVTTIGSDDSGTVIAAYGWYGTAFWENASFVIKTVDLNGHPVANRIFEEDLFSPVGVARSGLGLFGGYGYGLGIYSFDEAGLFDLSRDEYVSAGYPFVPYPLLCVTDVDTGTPSSMVGFVRDETPSFTIAGDAVDGFLWNRNTGAQRLPVPEPYSLYADPHRVTTDRVFLSGSFAFGTVVEAGLSPLDSTPRIIRWITGADPVLITEGSVVSVSGTTNRLLVRRGRFANIGGLNWIDDPSVVVNAVGGVVASLYSPLGQPAFEPKALSADGLIAVGDKLRWTGIGSSEEPWVWTAASGAWPLSCILNRCGVSPIPGVEARRVAAVGRQPGSSSGLIWIVGDVYVESLGEFRPFKVLTSALLPCIADWNRDASVNSGDLLTYLNDFSQECRCADIAPPGGDGALDSSDFLAFLNAFAQGC